MFPTITRVGRAGDDAGTCTNGGEEGRRVLRTYFVKTLFELQLNLAMTLVLSL